MSLESENERLAAENESMKAEMAKCAVMMEEQIDLMKRYAEMIVECHSLMKRSNAELVASIETTRTLTKALEDSYLARDAFVDGVLRTVSTTKKGHC